MAFGILSYSYEYFDYGVILSLIMYLRGRWLLYEMCLLLYSYFRLAVVHSLVLYLVEVEEFLDKKILYKAQDYGVVFMICNRNG